MDNEREETIRQRAYALWEANGRPSGKHEDHWHRAREEMHGLEDAPAASNDEPVHVAPAGRKAARKAPARRAADQ